MSLWGKTDAAANAPKWLSDNADNTNKSNDKDNVVFVDVAEAKVPGNKAKGLVTPGWNLYHTYTTASGSTRHIVEPLVAMKLSAASAGDAGVTGNTAVEDAIAADPTITISTQLQGVSANSTTNAVFTVAASVNNNTAVAYEWQSGNSTVFSAIASGTGISGLGTTTLTLTPASALHANGNYFRVVVSADGAASVTSNSALLTVS